MTEVAVICTEAVQPQVVAAARLASAAAAPEAVVVP